MGPVSAPPGKAARNQAEKKSGAGFLSVLIGLSLAVAAIAFFGRTKKGPAPAPSHPKARGDAASARSPISASVRTDPNAMNGWRDFNWGMTQDEVNAVMKAHDIIPTLEIHDNQGEPLIRLFPRVVGDSVSLTPELHFGSGRLASVVLYCSRNWATLIAYEQVKAHMTREIGLPPTHDDDVDMPGDSMDVRGSVWSFPRTTVELRLKRTENQGERDLLLTFKEPAYIK